MFSFKIATLLLIGIFKLACGQFIDPVLGPLPPSQLLAIRGPLYVDASSIVPLGPLPVMGPPVMGPPIGMGPPPLALGPPPPPIMGPPIMGPPIGMVPYGPGFVQLQYDETSDPVNQRPSDAPLASRRSARNENNQSNIQQLGHGNMNLQGNIQQITQGA